MNDGKINICTATLNADIELSQQLVLTKGSFTILGNNHTIICVPTGSFGLSENAAVNLGSPEYGKTLTIKSTDDTRCVLFGGDNTILNMYDN